MNEYPRILISGQYFHTKSGGGITLSNLFSGWDKEKIASTASFITYPSFEICNNYYQIGSKELRLRFPFNLKKRSNLSSSGRVVIRETSLSNTDILKTKKSLFRTLYDKILFSTGLIHYRSTFIPSSDFLDWIKLNNPQIIYSQLSSIEEMKIVATLKNILGVPLAVHIMDDWPSTLSHKYFPSILWRRIISRQLKRLLSDAKVLLSISEPMSEEYLKRYGLNFVPFHNPIDTKMWMVHSRTDCTVNTDIIKVLYSGRIGIGISQSLVDAAEAIDSLNLKGNKIKLFIQTPTEEHEILKTLSNFNCIVINPVVEYSQIPKIFSTADILLLANDFDAKAITFLKFSMPTKASEYMISGTPILVYSAEETAVTKFFRQNECGYCVTQKSIADLMAGISTLMQDQVLRNKLSQKAIEVALNKFDAEKVRSEFRDIIIAATKT